VAVCWLDSSSRSLKSSSLMITIVSATLRLEPLVRAHADEMFRPLSAATIYDYIPGRPPVSVAELRQRYHRLEQRRSPDGRQQWLNWVVRLSSGQCAGFVQATIHVTLSADFAYVIAPEYWGRGVAFEACQAVLPYLAREGGVQALFSTVDPRNARSIRLLERLGFREVAPERYPHGKVEPNDCVFTLCLDASAAASPTDRHA
jgi:ribosomal-protein-alanine N-acetyltransferase